MLLIKAIYVTMCMVTILPRFWSKIHVNVLFLIFIIFRSRQEKTNLFKIKKI